jgi:hypothetical protein
MKKLKLKHMLLKLLESFQFWFDFVIGYVMTNPHKLTYYHRYMYERYGTRYCTKEEFEIYWNGQPEDPGPEYVNQD